MINTTLAWMDPPPVGLVTTCTEQDVVLLENDDDVAPYMLAEGMRPSERPPVGRRVQLVVDERGLVIGWLDADSN